MYSFKIIIINTSDNFITYFLNNSWYAKQISFLKIYYNLVPMLLDYKNSSTFWMNLLQFPKKADYSYPKRQFRDDLLRI